MLSKYSKLTLKNFQTWGRAPGAFALYPPQFAIRALDLYGPFILVASYDKQRGLKTFTWYFKFQRNPNHYITIGFCKILSLQSPVGVHCKQSSSNEQQGHILCRYKPKETTDATWPLTTHPFTEKKYSRNGKSIEGIYEGGYQS